MKKLFLLVFALLVLVFLPKPVSAIHSWGGYHWARTTNPFVLNWGNNVSTAWSSYLNTAASDWSTSSVLDANLVSGGTTSRRCRPTIGRVEVCDYSYGNNGWLGLAQIWISGLHITQGTTKMNDSYFNTPKYNTPGWKQLVMCQETGHTFGLDHQDEIFNNPNLGTCMDYTNDPTRNDGLGNNLHPNAHDYDELGIIYSHLDTFTTVGQAIASHTPAGIANGDFNNASEWGKSIRNNGKVALFERDFGGGHKLATFVVWAN